MSDPAPERPAPVESQVTPVTGTDDLEAWRSRWESGQPFAVPTAPRGIKGRVAALVRRLLSPLVRALWKRQSAFNLSVIDHLETAARGQADLLRDLREVRGDLLRDVQNNHHRISHLEAFKRDGFGDVMRHSDALYAVVDQKLERYRSESRELWGRLGGLLAEVAADGGAATRMQSAWEEQAYLQLEDRFRGTREEIGARVEVYLPYLEGSGPIVDLGCGRGEALTVLRQAGHEARGVDISTEMVRQCARQGLDAVQGDLFAILKSTTKESLGGILSLHVIEHLEPAAVDRLVRLAWRALCPGGVLILETPNPTSLVVAARSFWRDPTHRRPVHPDTLVFLLEEAGFEAVERLDLRAFPDRERLPEIDLQTLSAEQRQLGQEINRLRDRLDDLLYGFQDYAIVGRKPGAARSGQSSSQTS